MQNNYTETIPFELGVKLKEAGYWNPGCTYDSSYNGPCYFVSSKKYYKEGVIAPWEEVIPAPTYGEVFDWFKSKKNICITMDPFFTFALKGNIGYTWKITYPDFCQGKLVTITENDTWLDGMPYGGSFKLTATAAIEFAITIEVPEDNTVEVNVDEL